MSVKLWQVDDAILETRCDPYGRRSNGAWRGSESSDIVLKSVEINSLHWCMVCVKEGCGGNITPTATAQRKGILAS